MLVRELMKADVAACAPADALANVATEMRNHKCGFVPIVSSTGALAGIVTDRDLALAVGGSSRTANRMSAAEVMSEPVFGCFSDENAKAALATMGKHHVRRLPMLDKRNGHLAGVLSIDDVVQAPRRRGGPTGEDIADALKQIARMNRR